MKSNLFVTLLAPCLVFLWSCTASSSVEISKASSPDQADLIIENVSIIDAENGLQADRSVVINGDQITQVFSSSEKKFVDAKQRIDGTGKYLIPGLWDAHVHLTYDPDIEDSMFRLFLSQGITSVRDTGGELDKVLARRESSRNTLAPTVYIAGPLIDGEPTVYDGKARGFPKIAETAGTPAEIERLVDELAAADVDLIKAYEMLSPESFIALLNRAKKHDLPVTGHVPLSMSAAQAAAAGLSSMEHLRNVEMDCSSEEDVLFLQRQALLKEGADKPGSKLRSEIHTAQHHAAVSSYDPVRCKKLLAQFAQYDVWQVPTLTLMLASKEPFFVDEAWWETYQYLPADVAAKWTKASEGFVSVMAKPSASRDKRIEVAEWRADMITKLIESDVKIMAGTDTPIFYLTPGFSLHKELQTLVNAGMTPLQAIESATLSPAKYFNLHESQGLIAPSMLADMVLLNANPLVNISNTSKIDSVVKHGALLEREQLDKLLNNY